MRQKFHNSSLASISNHESDLKSRSTSGATSLLIRRVAAGALLFIVVVTLGGFLASLPVRSRAHLGGSFPADFLHLVGIGSLTWYACLLSSPLYVWLARRFPISRQRWRRNLAIHFLITVAL